MMVSNNYKRFEPRREDDKNMMSNSSCERFEQGKEDEQKHHGELRNINNGGIRSIGGP
jgi:hypothetical protein